MAVEKWKGTESPRQPKKKIFPFPEKSVIMEQGKEIVKLLQTVFPLIWIWENGGITDGLQRAV